MATRSPQVTGIELDAETRCVHHHTSLDIIAIKLKCCGTYYACKDCHIALADHAIEPWPQNMWTEKAVLCGCCGSELSIKDYMASADRCPVCRAHFNPGCAKHHHFYFESSGGA